MEDVWLNAAPLGRAIGVGDESPLRARRYVELRPDRRFLPRGSGLAVGYLVVHDLAPEHSVVRIVHDQFAGKAASGVLIPDALGVVERLTGNSLAAIGKRDLPATASGLLDVDS
jgi:hypothetical protein